MDVQPGGRTDGVGDELIDRLPQVFTALDAGRLDIPITLMITNLLTSVDTALAVALVDKVIDQAEGWMDHRPAAGAAASAAAGD